MVVLREMRLVQPEKFERPGWALWSVVRQRHRLLRHMAGPWCNQMYRSKMLMPNHLFEYLIAVCIIGAVVWAVAKFRSEDDKTDWLGQPFEDEAPQKNE